MTEQKKNIELRSEKVRSIIGQVPSVLLRYGMVLIGIVLLLLIGIAAFIPYQESLPISAEVETSPNSVLLRASYSGHILWESKLKTVSKGEVLGYEQTRDSLFAIRASLSGKLCCIVQNRDAITKGEVLAVITPKGSMTYYAMAKVPQSLLFKVNQGEKVLFNSLVGVIVGRISNEYPVLDANINSSIRIVFEDKLPQNITAKTILQGKIIISEKSFLERFWDSLKMN
jgi:hypothetical protein